jgi:hypothetical protein
MPNPYPFTPKSSAKLSPGDFWSVPIQDGSFACGRVIELPPKGRPGAKVSFLGGLLDWHAPLPPTANSIANCRTVKQGVMHILAIVSTGGQVLGNRALELDGIEPFEMINGDVVQRGFAPIRAWVRGDNDRLATFSTWGYNLISLYAHESFLGYVPKDS